MREILFRGKDIKENWHIGLLVHIGNAWYILDIAQDSTAFEVIPETIGQYTGLTDKNGKMIFEGDIIKFGLISYVVKYDLENARYMLFDKDGYKRDGFNIDTMQLKSIDGNIHDNPELLKGDK